jgi:dynein heavy chain 2
MQTNGHISLYLISSGRGNVQWDFIHGLFESAIYGGRVDNPFDIRIMVSYVKQYFDNQLLGDQARGSRKLGPLKIPGTCNYRVR